MSSLPGSLPISRLGWFSRFMGWLDAADESAVRRPRARPAQPARVARPLAGLSEQPRHGEVDFARLMKAAQVAPQLPMMEWDGDCVAANDARADATPLATDGSRRLRDRYVAARFPGFGRSTAALEDAHAVVDAARLLFEDGDADLALELLELAIAEVPGAAETALARLEMLFLMRNAEAFVAAAREFRQCQPAHPAWAEVERLGNALVPDETLFAASEAPRAHDQYGPWPDLPNWIRAPWDLTSEVLASEFHGALRATGPAA